MSTAEMSLELELEALAKRTKSAAKTLATAHTAKKNDLLKCIAEKIEQQKDAITQANQLDLDRGQQSGLSNALLDRLKLNDKRMNAMVEGIRKVIELDDPIGQITKDWVQDQGVHLQRMRVPIGVIGIIFESRPNVTVDASALCLKSGNATLLRGGKEAIESNLALGQIISEAAAECALPREIVSVLPTTDRAAIPVLCHMNEFIDLMIPRGGHGLIKTVVEHARMPVIKHYDGICHVYIHEKTDPDMAVKIVLNAKTQRPGVCNAMETLLIDRSIISTTGKKIIEALKAAEVEIFTDESTNEAMESSYDPPESWSVEYLDLKVSVKVVEGLADAVDHIETYGSHHSDTIVTQDEEVAEQFLRRVDSSAVYWNVSTRFTDGMAFGMGAEIGISTDKIHARGPMALEELTSYKYVARGHGQIID
ncbi:MAG: glutamate-5-semialdehyde dehydrogenase [Verrucomicrobiota bacterium]